MIPDILSEKHMCLTSICTYEWPWPSVFCQWHISYQKIWILHMSYKFPFQQICYRHSINTKTNLLHLLGQQQRHKSDLSKHPSLPIPIPFVLQCRSERAEKLTVRKTVTCVMKSYPLEGGQIGMQRFLYRICTQRETETNFASLV